MKLGQTACSGIHLTDSEHDPNITPLALASFFLSSDFLAASVDVVSLAGPELIGTAPAAVASPVMVPVVVAVVSEDVAGAFVDFAPLTISNAPRASR